MCWQLLPWVLLVVSVGMIAVLVGVVLRLQDELTAATNRASAYFELLQLEYNKPQ